MKILPSKKLQIKNTKISNTEHLIRLGYRFQLFFIQYFYAKIIYCYYLTQFTKMYKNMTHFKFAKIFSGLYYDKLNPLTNCH